ncbi:Holliday junction ATP-dependent DNA helicase ruvA [Candidatus Moranella endobia PCVAL]|uniref:Holliday junction branch migration complex subunit RuvA n=1 Tax=Moranella endobia (strain PCIT) TaxID=903503 RepID=F7XXF5_MOREP|nr:Holliday junction branch migration protein RuvA [Candidatus Moranella endobia]AEI74781.1 Holliday junction DNA helicase RuvA [Candidatus Moranella endobia PCIT]AGJ61438.1 Holliday junction ATP-dependent DNA helicase ruvA [Candidatus Moranella endobia PCVAL]
MIGRLRGIILEKQPPQVLLETNGVGYEMQLPMTCFYALPAIGQEIIIFTHFVIREDAQLLFGFIHRQERLLFRELIKVNGVGPKLALAILSGMSAQQFVSAVERQEINALIKLPGVGKKTAERLVVEMKDRFKVLSSDLFAPHVSGEMCNNNIEKEFKMNDPEKEAVAALVTLGYKPQEASRMVHKVASADADCEMLIRAALRVAL